MKHVNIDLDLLRTLVYIISSPNWEEASKKVGRTPSAISQQMKRLEESLGVEIFYTKGRSKSLTETGFTVYKHAIKVLSLNDKFLEELRNDHDGKDL